MNALELLKDMDTQPKLSRALPVELLVADKDEAGPAWAQGIARDWANDLADSAQDIYALEDD